MNRRTQAIFISAIVFVLLLVGAFYLLNNKFHFLADITSQSIKYYVSPSGNDNWSGKLASPNSDQTDGPFATIVRARDAIREMKSVSGLSSPVNVVIRDGTYYLGNTIDFTDKDSGTASAPITYIGSGDKTTISGGEKISGQWTKCSNTDPNCNGLNSSAKSDIYYINVGDKTFNSLFVNDNRAIRARTPNIGQDTGLRDSNGSIIGAGFYNLVDCHQGTFKTNFHFRPGDINPNWKNLTDIETVVLTRWRSAINKIKSIEDNTVNLQGDPNPSSFDWDYCYDSQTLPGSRYYLDNVFEGLDTPGEWYLDKTSYNLYYLPKTGENMASAEVIAPKLKQLINISVTATGTDRVRYLNFKNLTFSDTNWDLPATGYYEVQSVAPITPYDGLSYQADYPASPAVNIYNATNSEFSNNTFKHISGHAILARDTDFILIDHNNIFDTGCDGIVFGEDHAMLTNNFTISNNNIHDVGAIVPSAVGILGLRTKNTLISHNSIYNAGYDGIQLGWCWSSANTGAQNNTVEYNYIHDVMKLMNDGAGIYVNGSQPGSIINNNIFNNINLTSAHISKHVVAGIYLDEGAQGIVVQNNIVFSNSRSLSINSAGADCIIQNNIFANGALQQLFFSSPIGITYSKNIVSYHNDNSLISGTIKDPEYTMDYNLYYNRGQELKVILTTHPTLTTWDLFRDYFGFDSHSLAADPQFSDPSAFEASNASNPLSHDYSLKSSSPALSLGFKQIDVKSNGPQGFVGPLADTGFLPSFPPTDGPTPPDDNKSSIAQNDKSPAVTVKPAPPAEVKAETIYPDNISSPEVKISWQPSPTEGIENYNIYRWQDSSQTFVKIGASDKDKLEFFDQSVVKGSSYLYVVRSVKDNYESDNSNQAEIQVESFLFSKYVPDVVSKNPWVAGVAAGLLVLLQLALVWKFAL